MHARRFARLAAFGTVVVGLGITTLATAASAVPGNGNSTTTASTGAAASAIPVVNGNGNGNSGNGLGNGGPASAVVTTAPVVASTPVVTAAPVVAASTTTSSGALSSAQIPATAGNGGGANQPCGDYCPTPSGPSLNGNGGGTATGKPCAGCVGNADSKNPPGQFKNGSDPNNGYECDGNHGIARTNPAHTGCKSTPPPACVPTPTVPCTPPACVGAGCSPTVTTTPPTTTPPTTTPPVIPTSVEALSGTNPMAAGPAVAPTATPVPTSVLGVSARRGSLPFTGVDVLLALRLAIALLLGGALTLWAGRRRAET